MGLRMPLEAQGAQEEAQEGPQGHPGSGLRAEEVPGGENRSGESQVAEAMAREASAGSQGGSTSG